MEKIYKIVSPDKKWYAEVSAYHGANVTKLQYSGENVFIPLESEKQLEKNPYIQGSPILLPANRTHKGEFWFEGKKYNLPINEPQNNANLHGFLHLKKFEVVKTSSCNIVLCYENKGEIYPFDFKITVEYSLNNDGFCQSYRVINTGNCNMPITFALHTTFTEPECFSVPIRLSQERDKFNIPTGRYIALNKQEESYTSSGRSMGQTISGYYTSFGNIAKIGQYKYSVSENFNYWILYNGGGTKGFLCVEPQCGAVNGLNIVDGHKIIEPGKEEIFNTTVSIL